MPNLWGNLLGITWHFRQFFLERKIVAKMENFAIYRKILLKQQIFHSDKLVLLKHLPIVRMKNNIDSRTKI